MLDSLRQFKAGIFKARAHPTRVAIVEYLRYGDRDEASLLAKVHVPPDEFAQHVAVLVKRNILRARSQGGESRYELHDPAFGNVLEAMREYFLSHLNEVIAQLRAEKDEDDRDAPGPPAAGG